MGLYVYIWAYFLYCRSSRVLRRVLCSPYLSAFLLVVPRMGILNCRWLRLFASRSLVDSIKAFT